MIGYDWPSFQDLNAGTDCNQFSLNARLVLEPIAAATSHLELNCAARLDEVLPKSRTLRLSISQVGCFFGALVGSWEKLCLTQSGYSCCINMLFHTQTGADRPCYSKLSVNDHYNMNMDKERILILLVVLIVHRAPTL